jgi:hypothetical protein
MLKDFDVLLRYEGGFVPHIFLEKNKRPELEFLKSLWGLGTEVE